MSKIVFLCFRDPNNQYFSNKEIALLSNRLSPDNISTHPFKTIDNFGILIGIFNPSDTLPIKNSSVCLGNMIQPKIDWWQPLSGIPDGSYALFRSDKNYVELISDMGASRTIWYFQNDYMFVASTSQRAIVFFLQDFMPNRAVYPWMLSSGHLGPDLSWDTRIKYLNANSRLLLCRSSWTISINKNPFHFDPVNLPVQEHERRLRNAMKEVFDQLHLDYSKWMLPLSGGYDSRAILLMLKNRKKLRCVTWGLRSSMDNIMNDAFIARRVANYFDLDHQYFETDISDEPIKNIFHRYLTAGEGRVDHIAGYLDGFKVWKFLFEKGISGIIRGDSGFGYDFVKTPIKARHRVNARFLSDYSNLNNLEGDEIEEQLWPEYLDRKENESLSIWRDRLYYEFRIPVIISALNDLKSPYLEVINPLLSRHLVACITKLPDSLRDNRKLYKEIITSESPNIPFAKYSATAVGLNYKYVFRNPQVVNEIANELSSTYAGSLLSNKFIEYVLRKMEVLDIQSSTNRVFTRKLKGQFKKTCKSILPGRIQAELQDSVFKLKMDYNELAFRAYIISKMNQILREDANALNAKYPKMASPELHRYSSQMS